MTAATSAISVTGVRKAYGPTVALDDVTVEIGQGTVHALLGENGAGKSTLVKMLSGLVTPDQGEISILGQKVNLHSPLAAQRLGVQTAFQEMTLLRNLTVLDNMLIPRASVSPIGMIRRAGARRDVARHFEELGLAGFELDDEIGELDLAVRQKIEIARAVYRKPKVLLLDEPTSALSGPDVVWMGEVIKRERARGTTVIFISHRLREVRDYCDELTILRGGKHIASGHVKDYADEDVVRMIAGRSLIHSFPPRTAVKHEVGAEVLGARNAGTDGKLRDASFSLRAGEILGVAGLQGMGQLELFLSIFGDRPLKRGHLMVNGEKVVFTSSRDAISAKIGISLVPEERKTEGLFLRLSGTHNATIPVVDRFTKMGLIDREEESEAVRRVFRQVNVAERAEWMPAESFSGGNQQKIAIAKWLLTEARVLLVYDPTRGIDVGTKNEIYQLLRTYAEAGGAVLFYSTEIPELVHLSDRTMVFYSGSIAAELSGDDLTEENILAVALGSEPERAPTRMVV
ncbi:sugar ABC transporter ATP-binding protein [Tabrizicola sp. J26]|uniref:sugar ABC transporter ATP-binding protein n=1 Tax=Alitabrizicola rongguiensis TaxID=2909234 RepID=UPI001F397F46|nr:sugar ABC transporter ATP-binding protein [Tabrizicola rongguiensis]MCF1707924.1 sugar ABC transporter ATP-binding protein [Tabrizicola rongguiensis]